MNDAGSSHPAGSIAVVGGGIIGLSIAWRLAQRGWQIVVFDKGSAGAEASWAGAGMLAPGGEVHGDLKFAALAIESRDMYEGYLRELESISGLSIDYQSCGGLELAYSSAELAELEERASTQSALGVQSKPVSAANIRAFWPRIQTEGLSGARFYPGDGIVNPREVVSCLKAACHKQGVDIREQQAVRSIAVESGGVTLSAPMPWSVDAVVLAAGAWSGSVEITGVPHVPASEPVKGQLIGYQQPEQTCTTIIRRGRTYLLQRSAGLLVAGASVEHAGFDRTVSPQTTAELAAEAGFIMPHLTETTPTESWTGFRPGAAELHIGKWHSDRLYLAYGHYRNGILLAPITAALIAQAITTSLGTPRRDDVALQ